MFGMEKIATKCNKDEEKKLEKKALMEAFVDKEASDHVHTDSEGKKTGPSIHEDDKEENPHIHKLEDEGTTDKKENTPGHKHKELDEDGGETGPAEKTAGKVKDFVTKMLGGGKKLPTDVKGMLNSGGSQMGQVRAAKKAVKKK
jgi:hypothetical protein